MSSSEEFGNILGRYEEEGDTSDVESSENEVAVSVVTTLFELDEDVCDITILTFELQDGLKKIPAKYIDFISEKLNTLATKETKEIDITNLKVSWKSIQQAISFYHPKNYIKLNDNSQFEELLTLCEEWNLTGFRETIKEYLIKHHSYGLQRFCGKLSSEHIQMLQLFEKFKLEDIVEGFMADITSTNLLYSQGLESLGKEVQYEIWKVRIENLLKSDTNKSELYAILNFFNFLVYEDRVIDEYVKKKFKKQPEYQIYDEINQSDSDFKVKKFGANVTLVVNGTKLYVNSNVLIESSPVFKRRLENLGDKDLVLELPWQNIKEVVLLLTFLTKPLEVDNHIDLFALASLCKEYQVQWIIEKIRRYTEEINFTMKTYQDQLRFLKLASIMKFDQIKEKLIRSLKEPFQVLKMTEEFTWLNTSTKILIARKCLFALAGKHWSRQEFPKSTFRGKNRNNKAPERPDSQATFKSLTNTKDRGLLSILKEHSQIETNFTPKITVYGGPLIHIGPIHTA